MPNKRKSITLEKKLDIIRRVENGEKKSVISNQMKLAYSTVATIINQSEKIKTSIKNNSNVNAKEITRIRSKTIEKVEKMLSIWIDDMAQRHMPISQMTIQNKAINLFNFLKNRGEEKSEENFVASRGWFEKFKKRAKIHSIRMTGEAASADIEAARNFSEKLGSIIERGRYPPNLIFNVDETGLFWKCLPSKTFISREEKVAPGFKAAKDRLTLLIGSNSSGDFKLKPMLVYHSENPRAMKGISKSTLPVIWKSNKKAWIGMNLFNDWFVNHFCVEVQRYCKEKDLEPRALLILDNAPGHSRNLGELETCIQVEIVFLPPNTTSIIQPMDQGVIATFKAHYLRSTFSQLIEASDNHQISIKEFWKNYNIVSAIKNIQKSWEEISQHCLKASWKKIGLNLEEDVTFNNDVIQDDLVNMAHQLDFSEVNAEDIQRLFNDCDRYLTNEELQEMVEGNVEQEDINQRVDIEVLPKKALTTKILSFCINQISHSLDILSENDPNFERSCGVRRDVLKALTCYSEMLREGKMKAKQSTLDLFLSKN